MINEQMRQWTNAQTNEWTNGPKRVFSRPVAGGYTDDVATTDATRRIAVVDQEWQHLRAVDLLVVLRSFAPKSGVVRRVTVYPSDFGLERMKVEAVHGPLAAFGLSAEARSSMHWSSRIGLLVHALVNALVHRSIDSSPSADYRDGAIYHSS